MGDDRPKSDKTYLYRLLFFCALIPLFTADCATELVSAELQCEQSLCQIVDTNRMGCSSSMASFDVREVTDVRTLETTPEGKGRLRGHKLRSQHTVYVSVETQGENSEIQVSRSLPEKEARKVVMMLETVRSNYER